MIGVLAVVRSEATKVLTLPSVWIVTGALFALSLYFQFQAYLDIGEVLATLDENGMHWWYGRPVPAEEDILAGVGAAVFNPGIFFPVLGAVIAGAEFRTGQLGLSVLAVPNRSRMVMGKTLVTASSALGFGLVFAAMTLASTYLAVKDWRPGLVRRPEALAGVGGSILFVLAVTLTTFAITLITRRTVVGILVMVAFTALVLTQALHALSPVLDALTPISAARNMLLQGDTVEGGPPFSSSPQIGALVLVGWVVVSVTGAVLAVRARDAR